MSIPILMYHQIDVPPPRGTPLRGLVVSPGAFSRQMFLLKCMGYMGLSMRRLEPYLSGEQSGRVVGITFDDGYHNNLQNALPVLKKHGFSATCYAVSGMIGGVNSWDRDIGVAQKPLMSTDDWQVWLNEGMEIGSHTHTHADLTQLSAEAADNEITISRQELEDNLGCEVRHFCYPYGRFDATHLQMVQKAGYTSATTTRRGRAQSGDDPFTLRRVLVAQATNLVHFVLKITTSYEDRRG
jgi:peptidoglycan/xylan/chitin deacetylase (PgdA/CDA1 family)